MKVYHVPNRESRWPPSGGVREHICQLQRHMRPLNGVEFVDEPGEADVIHVQSAYCPPDGRAPDMFTCHGGFLPEPGIPQVQRNLRASRCIISVAGWLAEAFFSFYIDKTVVIPNGIDLDEWDGLGPSGLEPGYVLWGKEWHRPDWTWFYRLAQARPDLRFVSTVEGRGEAPLPNLHIIGPQPREKMRRVMNDCAVYVSTGSEVCPTMVLEAWACGKPVLAWNGHGNRELLKTNNGAVRGGALYADLEGMVTGLKFCLEGAKDYGEQGRALVEERYQWPDLARRTLEVYERL